MKNKVIIGIVAVILFLGISYYKVAYDNSEEKMARFYAAARALNEKDHAKAQAIQEQMKPEWNACNSISSDKDKKAREDCFQAIYDKWTDKFK